MYERATEQGTCVTTFFINGSIRAQNIVYDAYATENTKKEMKIMHTNTHSHAPELREDEKTNKKTKYSVYSVRVEKLKFKERKNEMECCLSD